MGEEVLDNQSFHASGPLCWGPLQWMTLHQMARGFPKTNPSKAKQDAAKAYVLALVDLLPCSLCAMHWKDIAPTVQTDSRHNFLKWTIDVHNAVNKRTNKKVLSYKEAVDAITGACKDNCLSINTVKASTSTADKGTVIALSVVTAALGLALIIMLVLYLTSKRSKAENIS